MFKPSPELVRTIDKFLQHHHEMIEDELPDDKMPHLCERLGQMFNRRLGVYLARQRDFSNSPECPLIEDGHFCDKFFNLGATLGDLWEIPRFAETGDLYEMIAREFIEWLKQGENAAGVATAHVARFIVEGDSVRVLLKPKVPAEDAARDRSRTPTVTFE